jgi:hypothetical protein
MNYTEGKAMSKRVLIPWGRILATLAFILGLVFPAAAATNARVSESYGKLPLYFEANHGQTDKDVRFLSRGSGYSLYLTASEAVLVLVKSDAKAQEKSVALRMGLVGGARKPLVNGLEEQPGKANYFIGKDRSKWRTNVPTYAKVRYREVYPGIDLVYYGNQRQLEYDFVVAPGADPKKIVLAFKGADKLEIDTGGDLVLHTAGGDIRQHKPIIYQNIDGSRREIEGGYVRKGVKRVGFQVAAYDPSRPLVIDPTLAYSTYLGGSGSESGSGIAVDANGNAYVTGNTNSIDFPTTSGAFQPAFGGGPSGPFSGAPTDVFVTKLNSAGSALVYSTYLGGTGNDSAVGIAVDTAGNAYLTGTTDSTDFPTTVGAFQPVSSGFGDSFVTKLDPTGSSVIYSTYLGGNQSDSSSGIAVDANGNAYVTGSTNSPNFPTSSGAFQPTFLGGGLDAFVTKLDPTGNSLVYSTYLGGTAFDNSTGIAVDANGNAYVTGSTSSANFPTTPGAFSTSLNGGGAITANPGGRGAITPDLGGGGAPPPDVFVIKLDPGGSTLVYSTYLGGSGLDSSNAISIDRDGNAYMTGQTRSTDFPTTPGAFQPIFNGGSTSAFVTKLDATGSGLVYSTYLAGRGVSTNNKNAQTIGNGVAVDAAGDAYVTGSTTSSDFPTTVDAFQPIFAGSVDAFVTKFDATGSLLIYSTYLGGNSSASGRGIALDPNGNAYVTGGTSGNFPTTLGAFQMSFGGTFDAFVAKVVDAVPPLTVQP